MFRYLIIVLTVLKICNSHIITPNFHDKTSVNNLTRLLFESKNKLKTSSQVEESRIEAALMILTSFVLFNSKELINESHYIKFHNAENAKIYLREFISGIKSEDVLANFGQIVNRYGFGFERHSVTTEDGYILTVFRIPSAGQPILLMHGLLGSSDDFILAGVDSALGYLLARDGYDVWVGNARGNKYSRKHRSLKPSHVSFWDFSWHEIGLYDLPAIIDYILEMTNRTSLKYIGHSQGTTAFFVMLSELPAFNKKVSLMIALSPVAYMSKAKSPIIRMLSPVIYKLPVMSQNLGVHEFLPDNDLIQTLKKALCGEGLVEDLICSNSMYLVFGCNFPQVNVSNLPIIFGHLPAGASVKQFAHYGQGLISGEFRRFDYGVTENLVKYGTKIPPIYKVQDIVTPISIFFSDNDWMADVQDVAYLSYKMKSVIDIYKIPSKGFNHLDFILAKDVKSLVNLRILNVLRTL